MTGIRENRTSAWAQLASFGLEDGVQAPPFMPPRAVDPLPQTAAPPPLAPAPQALRVLTSLEEVLAATHTVLHSARRLVSIMTPDLEPALYDQPLLLETIKHFVLSHSFAKVRVLVREQTHLSAGDNRFVAMARRLTSYLEIRIRAAQYNEVDCAYCIADDRAILYRLRADRWDGIASFNNPPIARQYLQDFDVIWQDSAQERQLAQAR